MIGVNVLGTKMTANASQMEQGSDKKASKKYFYIFATSVTFLLVIGAVVAAFYIGAKVSKDNFKEAFVTFRERNGVITKEKVSIHGNEVIVNGQAVTLINDYEKFLSVFRVEDKSTCYVTSLNTSDVGTIDEMRGQLNTTVDVLSELEYRPTSIPVNLKTLGERAQRTCGDFPIFWLARGHKHTGALGTESRVKRKKFCWKKSWSRRIIMKIKLTITICISVKLG